MNKVEKFVRSSGCLFRNNETVIWTDSKSASSTDFICSPSR